MSFCKQKKIAMRADKLKLFIKNFSVKLYCCIANFGS